MGSGHKISANQWSGRVAFSSGDVGHDTGNDAMEIVGLAGCEGHTYHGPQDPIGGSMKVTRSGRNEAQAGLKGRATTKRVKHSREGGTEGRSRQPWNGSNALLRHQRTNNNVLITQYSTVDLCAADKEGRRV